MTAVDLLLLHGASPAAAAITLDALATANRLQREGEQRFSWRVLAPKTSRARLRHDIVVRTTSLERSKPAAIVIVPGLGCTDEAELASLLRRADAVAASEWLRRAAAAGSTIAASCTGVFLLGAAGLLDGRHCTTSWWLTRALATRHGAARVDSVRMVIEDRGVLTAGASLAHLDLMLRLIHRCGGAALAQRTASYLVVDQRPSQAPYIIPTALQAADPIAQAIEAHVSGRIASPITLSSLARALHMSPRTLTRRMRSAMGCSPMGYVRRLRSTAATHLLRTTKLPLARVAERVGLADASVLYRVVKAHTGLAPGTMRQVDGKISRKSPRTA